MGFSEMSQMRRRAWLSAVIWALAAIGFCLTFFAWGGPREFASDSIRHAVGAGAVGFGFAAYWTVLWLTRQREGAPLAFDERDAWIVARANQSTLVVVLVGIFALVIGLWTAYEASGEVPVGWMWFVAYGSVILASVVSPVITLILDGRMDGGA